MKSKITDGYNIPNSLCWYECRFPRPLSCLLQPAPLIRDQPIYLGSGSLDPVCRVQAACPLCCRGRVPARNWPSRVPSPPQRMSSGHRAHPGSFRLLCALAHTCHQWTSVFWALGELNLRWCAGLVLTGFRLLLLVVSQSVPGDTPLICVRVGFPLVSVCWASRHYHCAY